MPMNAVITGWGMYAPSRGTANMRSVPEPECIPLRKVSRSRLLFDAIFRLRLVTADRSAPRRPGLTS